MKHYAVSDRHGNFGHGEYNDIITLATAELGLGVDYDEEAKNWNVIINGKPVAHYISINRNPLDGYTREEVIAECRKNLQRWGRIHGFRIYSCEEN